MTLFYIGMKRKDMVRIFLLQGTISSLTGVCIGVFSIIMLPSFLLGELTENSALLLSVPVDVILLGVVLCFGCTLFARGKRKVLENRE